MTFLHFETNVTLVYALTISIQFILLHDKLIFYELTWLKKYVHIH